jgi:hypothetical protein
MHGYIWECLLKWVEREEADGENGLWKEEGDGLHGDSSDSCKYSLPLSMHKY